MFILTVDGVKRTNNSASWSDTKSTKWAQIKSQKLLQQKKRKNSNNIKITDWAKQVRKGLNVKLLGWNHISIAKQKKTKINCG